MPEPTYAELAASHAQLLEQQDEWRKTIKEMGAENERLTDQLGRVSMTAAADRKRANEAARLSAAARDENADVLKQVDAMREQVEIVEESRSDLIVELDRLERQRADVLQLCADAPPVTEGIGWVRTDTVQATYANGRPSKVLAESELARLRGLMAEAKRRHGEEMTRSGEQPWQHISGFGAATAAAIIEERDEARADNYRLRGQVVTLLGLCDGLKRFPGYEPANAWVMVHEIERIFEGFDRRNAPVDSAPAAGVVVQLSAEVVAQSWPGCSCTWSLSTHTSPATVVITRRDPECARHQTPEVDRG